METKDIADLVQALAPILGVVCGIAGAAFGGWLQARLSRKQSQEAQKNQQLALAETHRQNLEVITLQQKREEDLRLRQFAESDRADRLVVTEYLDLIMMRLIQTSSIYYLGSDNRDDDERQLYLQLQKYMNATEIDPAHPEKTAALRMAFLLFQLMAAMRIALDARWTRPLTDVQTKFLAHWEEHLEPMICSGRYPGKELLYREQVEIITEEMLTRTDGVRITRPLNWAEFCKKYSTNVVVKELTEVVARKFRFVFDETKSLPPRKATQCRLAIMALYLIQLSRESGNDSWNRREENLWRTITEWFKWERDQGQAPEWFVFSYGDVAARIKVAPALTPVQSIRSVTAPERVMSSASHQPSPRPELPSRSSLS